MLICAAGDIHGAIDRLYVDVLELEARLGARFDWVLHVGDFGVWPDPSRVDKATAKHDGAGDFAAWLSERREAPRKTLFIKGNHEDFEWLEEQRGVVPEVLPGLHYLPNGRKMEISNGRESVRVGGLGGCYAPTSFERTTPLEGRARSHYTRGEIETLGKRGVDVLLMHDAPAGVRFAGRGGYVSGAAGLGELVAAVRPKVCFFGHHHQRVDAEISGVRCIGLNVVGRPGNLVAVDLDVQAETWTIVGESGGGRR